MKRGAAWPIAVGVILGTCVAANIWIIHIANSDPSFAIEENYYQRAVHWDDEMAQQRRNQELGWRLLPSLSGIGRDSGGAELRVALRDAAVSPITGAAITVRAVHLARANQPLEATLLADAGGGYTAQLPIRRPGLWELRFEVRRGGERFTATERLDARLAQP